MFCIFWLKLGEPSLNGWRVIVRTSKSWHTDRQTDTHTDAGNDNTRRPKGPRVKMGFFETTFGAHLTFANNSVVLWNVILWGSYCMVHPWCILTGTCRASVLQSFLSNGRFWPPSRHEHTSHNIDETCLWRQKWSKHHTRLESEHTSSISLTYLCSWDVQNVDFLPFSCVCLRPSLRVVAWETRQRSAARGVIWIERGNFISVGESLSTEATVKSSMVRWFCRLPPELYLTVTEMENLGHLIFFSILNIILI